MASVLNRAAAISPLQGRRSIFRGSPCTAAAVFAVLAVPALAVDLPLAQACRHGDSPGDVARLVELAEVFAHGMGVAMVLLTVFVLDPSTRRRLVRVAACAYGGGVLANGVKLLVGRTRPGGFAGTEVLDTFQGWIPFVPGRIPGGWGHAVQGFPSGHAATAAGLALGLTMLYPHGRWLFFGFAALASFQRIAGGAHFLSDVLLGAALGCIAAALLQRGGILGRSFDRWEGRDPVAPSPLLGGEE